MMNNTALPERQVELARAALQLQQAGFHEDALELIEKAIRLAPGYATAYVLQGLSLQDLDRPEPAESAFRKAIKLAPKNELALKSYGLFLEQTQRYKDAIPYLEKYNEKYPDDKIILDKLIFALNATNQQPKIQPVLEKSWEKTGDAETGIRFSRFLLGNEENAQALAVIQKVAEAFPSPRTLTELSLVLVVLEQYQEAIAFLENALEIDPAFDRALRGLSFCYTKLNRMEEAIEFADKALAINNKHYRNWQAKGDALLALGQFEDALFTSQTALDLIDLKADPEAEPVMDVLYLQRFNSLLGLGKEEEALREIEKARTLLPREERFYIYPAQLLLGLGQIDQAVEMIEKAREAGMLAHFPHELRIQILLEAGRYQALWDWLDPQLSEPVIERLTKMSIDFYLKGESDIPRHIFQHFLEKYPQSLQFATFLGYILTGEGEYEQAEALIAQVLVGDIEALKPLANCNLGFIHLAKNDTAAAKHAFLETLANATDDEDVIVRVGFWQKASAELCCAMHPVQSLSLKLAATANLVAVYLQDNDLEQARKLANQIVKQFPEISLAYQVMGSVEHYQDNLPAAESNWQKSLQLSVDQIESQMIQDWLTKLRAG